MQTTVAAEVKTELIERKKRQQQSGIGVKVPAKAIKFCDTSAAEIELQRYREAGLKISQIADAVIFGYMK